VDSLAGREVEDVDLVRVRVQKKRELEDRPGGRG
jgi:hypothetical protein